MPKFRTLMLRKTILLVLVLVLQSKMAIGGTRDGTSVLTLRTNERHLTNRAKSDISKTDALTSYAPKTDAPRRRKFRYTVRLQLPDLTMDQFLNDKSSPQHQQLTQLLANDIQQLFANTSGDQRVHNLRFSVYSDPHKEPGSLAERASWQKETAVLPPSINSKPLPFVLSTSPPSHSLPTKISKLKVGRTRPTRKPSVAAKKASSTVSSAKKSRHRKRTKKVNTRATATTTATSPTTTTRLSTTSSSTRTPTKSMTTPSEKVFDVVHITRLFKDCYTRDYHILLEPYMYAYSELLSIFKVLGPVFTFAGDDAKGKLNQLRELREQDMASMQNNYVTIQSMFEYEYSPQGAKAELEGVSTNAWIHRVLKFISGVINAALEVGSEVSLGNRAQELYSEIMAPHHEWYIRAAAYLAFLSFPSRSSLMAQLDLTDSAEHHQALADLASAIDAVYVDVENLYVKYSS